ncbi:hypothetical protein ACHAPV_001740 [Trichoderma viride]
MALEFNEQDLLYKLAYECETHLDRLLATVQKLKSDVGTIEICADFQQRFAIWTAYLGVFAQKSQCLDTRLRNLPDLQDLVARLLDILRRGLKHILAELASQRENELVTTSDSECLLGASQIQTTALEAIDDTIARLNRLGITIRQSSSSKIDTRAKKFTAGHNMDSFACLCANVVQALYPGASQPLKDYLSESMISRYARMSFFRFRKQNLEARREALPPIEEISGNETQTNVHINPSSKKIMHPPISHLRRAHNTPTISDLSSVDIQQISRGRRRPDEASTKFYKTSSIQVKQGNYPQPPKTDEGNNIFACQWCGEPFIGKELSETDWRDDFSSTELQTISRQSKVEQSRAWNDCLLCCFTIKERKGKDESIASKRQNTQQKQETVKSSRKNLETTGPDHPNLDLELSGTSSDSDNAGSHQQTKQRQERSNTVARHIAAHLQVLMLLTLRFAALQSNDKDADDDLKSNSVDVDEENSAASEDSDVGRLSPLSSLVDVAMRDTDDEKNKETAKRDTQFLSTGLRFDLTLKQYDDLEARNNDNGRVTMWLSQLEKKPDTNEVNLTPKPFDLQTFLKTGPRFPHREDENSDKELGLARFASNLLAVPSDFHAALLSPRSQQQAILHEEFDRKPSKDDSEVKYGYNSERESGSTGIKKYRGHTFPDIIPKPKKYIFSPTAESLFEAIENKDMATIRKALENEVDLETTDEFGRTLLWRAVECDQVSVIQLLLDNGADIEAKNIHGQNILDWALKKGREDIVERVLARLDSIGR